MVVHTLHFNNRFVDELLTRIEENLKPEEVMPAAIIFNEAEIDRMGDAVREVEFAPALRRRLEFFASARRRI